MEIDSDDPLAALLRTLVSQLHRVDAEIDDLYDQRFIDTATNRELELIGANVGVERRTGESDDSFRSRVRAGYRIATSDGTFKEIARAALALLDADPADIQLEGPPATDGGVGRVLVPDILVDESPLSQTEIASELTRAAPLGHRIEVLTDDTLRLGVSGDQGLGAELL
ncbi:hypothetical protein DJ71_02355 [Halorubrum sp. E3]|nr:hypothetical protein DJ71_02355 [Halorubrum sp. E3]